ncbi:hypothetical protein HDV05_007504 [Chytridiales sp. JEL 0842]|nr:hypothetical protein HDV05_007504 [Chytridiales sp. JEL 0842]
MRYVGPLPSNLHPCLIVCKKLHAATVRAFSSVTFQSVHQRTRFAKLVSSTASKESKRALRGVISTSLSPSRFEGMGLEEYLVCGTFGVIRFNDSDLSAITQHNKNASSSSTTTLAPASSSSSSTSLTATLKPPKPPCLPYHQLAFNLRHLDFGLRPLDSPPTTPTPFTPSSSSSSIRIPSTPNNTRSTTPASSLPSTPIFTPSGPLPINMILSPSSPTSPPSYHFQKDPYGSQWEDRFITTDFYSIAISCPNIQSLCLAGCQLSEPTFSESLKGLHSLKHLDVSHSSVKGSLLDSIAISVGSTLRSLDVSGLFRFRRNPTTALLRLVDACPNLKRLVAIHCPDITKEVREECMALNPSLEFVWSADAQVPVKNVPAKREVVEDEMYVEEEEEEGEGFRNVSISDDDEVV